MDSKNTKFQEIFDKIDEKSSFVLKSLGLKNFSLKYSPNYERYYSVIQNRWLINIVLSFVLMVFLYFVTLKYGSSLGVFMYLMGFITSVLVFLFFMSCRMYGIAKKNHKKQLKSFVENEGTRFEIIEVSKKQARSLFVSPIIWALIAFAFFSLVTTAMLQ